MIQSIEFVGGESGENEYGPWTAYSAKATILPDGAEKATEQYMPAGFLRGDNTISKNGRSIEGEDAYSLDGNSPFGQFVISLVEGEGTRFPEDRLGDLRSYEAVDGTRVTFIRALDAVKTEKMAKAGKPTKRKGKNGKEYNFDVLLVGEVLALPGEKKAGKSAGKANGKATATAPVAANDVDATDAALITILGGAKDHTLSRSKVSSSVIGYALKAGLDGAAREAVRKMLSSDEYVADAAERGLIVVDGEGKAANLILAIE